MLFHVSIAADHPERVARFIAGLWSKGDAQPFPPCPGAWIVFAHDGRGTAIEVNPQGLEMHPGGSEPLYQKNPDASRFTASHQAIGTPLSVAEVLEHADREGYTARVCHRGAPDLGFDVIEVWLENRTLVEVLTAEMQADYLTLVKPENYRRLLAAGPPRA